MKTRSADSPPKIRVAIDGPAGVGKTTTARTLARDLGILYVDTGAMYRAVAVIAGRCEVSLDDPEGSTEVARSLRVELEEDASGTLRVLADGEDLSRAIRTDAASDGASRISIHPGVRRELVRWQREIARRRGVVMEGRDIGTVVLPDAEAKVFLTASSEERARRRWRELAERGEAAALEAVLRDIRERDARDQGREVSPLRPAPDAVVLDCTALDLPSQLASVRRVVEAVLAMRESGERADG